MHMIYEDSNFWEIFVHSFSVVKPFYVTMWPSNIQVQSM